MEFCTVLVVGFPGKEINFFGGAGGITRYILYMYFFFVKSVGGSESFFGISSQTYYNFYP